MLRFTGRIVKFRRLSWIEGLGMSAKRVGIVGAGQLARMTAPAAVALGIDLRVLATAFHESAAKICPDVVIGSPNDPKAIEQLAAACDVITFDHELVDTDAIQRLEAGGHQFAPSGATMAIAQSKRLQRERFASLGLAVPAFAIAEGDAIRKSAMRFADEHSWPVMLKADRGGYDGRGVWVIRSEPDLEGVAGELASRGIAAVVEACVPIDAEVAVQVARSPSGEIRAYPLVETIQVDGMLRELLAPAEVAAPLQAEAVSVAETIAKDTALVGLLAVELFVSNGKLLVNEIATRPHNSGHYTIEGAETSQFEQHLRAILDLPLGSTALMGAHVVTVNAVGRADGLPLESNLRAALAVEGVHVHIYGKEPRPGRKLGHVTVVSNDRQTALERARVAARLLEGGEANDGA
jgi:5-(carboxyamino)imidazole ribonucleotide synthase